MVLYKYSAINDGLKASLRDHYVWFSSPTSFNDINDSGLRLDDRYTDEDIHRELEFQLRLSRTLPMPRGVDPRDLEAAARSLFSSALADRGPDGRPDHSGRLHASVENAFKMRRQAIGISCFSQDSHNKLLWAHYGGAHYGVCLGVETSLDTRCFPQLEQVRYVDVLPKVKLLSHMGDNLVKLYTTKSSEWSYEREVRAFQHAAGAHAMDPRCLVSVAFGERASESDVDEISRLVRDNYGSRVALLRASHEEDGALAFRGLSE